MPTSPYIPPRDEIIPALGDIIVLKEKVAALNDSLAEAFSGLPLHEPDPDKPPH